MNRRFDPHPYAMQLVDSGDIAADGEMLYRWTGTHWNADSDEACERHAYRWIVEHDRDNAGPENARKAHKAAILWASSLPTPTSAVVIPCRNGYVHIGDGHIDFKPADKSLGLRHVLACDYQPDCPSPVQFERFLESVLPDPDVRGRLQEYIGYTLTADARYQRAQIWLGKGANGKGVLVNIIQALHGCIAAVNLDALDGFKLSVLIGASLIYADEIPRTRVNESLLKSLIAGEKIVVDRKYREAVSVHVRGKWLVLGNHLPAVTDHSIGFWRRWDIVPFDVHIEEEDRDPLLAQRIIDTELAGVLNWALEGLCRLQNRGAFDPVMPAAMAKVLGEAKSETNSVLAWHEDCEIGTTKTPETPKGDVYSHYRSWCETNGLTAMAAPRFWTRLRDIVKVAEERRREYGSQVRVCNIALHRFFEPE